VWRNIFENPLDWPLIRNSAGILMLHIGVFLSVSFFHFNRKDVHN